MTEDTPDDDLLGGLYNNDRDLSPDKIPTDTGSAGSTRADQAARAADGVAQHEERPADDPNHPAGSAGSTRADQAARAADGVAHTTRLLLRLDVVALMTGGFSAVLCAVWWFGSAWIGVPDELRRASLFGLALLTISNIAIIVITKMNFFALLGGYVPHGRENHAERLRSSLMGLVIVTVTGAAAFVAGYVLTAEVFDVHGWRPIGTGLAWAVLIITFDSLLMRQNLPSGITRNQRLRAWARWLILMGSRMALALIVAYFVATPLTLAYIADSVNQQMNYDAQATARNDLATNYPAQVRTAAQAADQSVNAQKVIYEKSLIDIAAQAKVWNQLYTGTSDCSTNPNQPGIGPCYTKDIAEEVAAKKDLTDAKEQCDKTLNGAQGNPGTKKTISNITDSLKTSTAPVASTTQSHKYVDRLAAYSNIEKIAAGIPLPMNDNGGSSMTLTQAQGILRRASSNAGSISCTPGFDFPVGNPGSQTAATNQITNYQNGVTNISGKLPPPTSTTPNTSTNRDTAAATISPQHISRTQATNAVTTHKLAFSLLFAVDLIPVLTKLLSESRSAKRVRTQDLQEDYDTAKNEETWKLMLLKQDEKSQDLRSELKSRQHTERLQQILRFKQLLRALFRQQESSAGRANDDNTNGTENRVGKHDERSHEKDFLKGDPAALGEETPLQELILGLEFGDWILNEEMSPRPQSLRRLFHVTRRQDGEQGVLKAIKKGHDNKELIVIRSIKARQDQKKASSCLPLIFEEGVGGEGGSEYVWFITRKYSRTVHEEFMSRSSDLRTWGVCADIGLSILSALQEVNAIDPKLTGGVHNDIKASNVVIDSHPDWVAYRLIDFGLADRQGGTRGWRRKIKKDHFFENLNAEIHGAAGVMYWIASGGDFPTVDAEGVDRDNPPKLESWFSEGQCPAELTRIINSWLGLANDIPFAWKRPILMKHKTIYQLAANELYHCVANMKSDGSYIKEIPPIKPSER